MSKQNARYNDMAPVPTRYENVLFRSRLEARWAVYFSMRKWSWVYEPQRFKLKNGKSYLPDFYLPDFHCHIEVKPTRNLTNDEIELLIEYETYCDEARALYREQAVGQYLVPLVVLIGLPNSKDLALTGDVYYYNEKLQQHVWSLQYAVFHEYAKQKWGSPYWGGLSMERYDDQHSHQIASEVARNRNFGKQLIGKYTLSSAEINLLKQNVKKFHVGLNQFEQDLVEQTIDKVLVELDVTSEEIMSVVEDKISQEKL
jgi:hypothetical protein